MEISHLDKYSDPLLEIELRCIVSIDHPWDVSTTLLESTCGKYNWLDMIWKGTHQSIYSPTVGSVCQSKNHAMWSMQLSVELRDRIVSRHRSGELWQRSRVPLWRWENIPEGQPSLQNSTNQGVMVEWPDGSHSSVKGTWQPAWNLPKGT